MRLCQKRGRARHAHGPPADHRIEELERFARRVLKQLRRGAERRGLAPVKRGDLARGGIVPDKEGTAAEARALRLHQPSTACTVTIGIRGGAALRENLAPASTASGFAAEIIQ